MNPLRIIVKPVPRESVQRRHLTPVKIFDPSKGQFVDTGQVSGKLKAKNATESLPFQPNREIGKYRTGLEEMVDNDFYQAEWITLKSQKNLSNKWDHLLPKLVEQSKISRQTLYEIMDGVDPDFYSPNMTQDMLRPNTVFKFDDKKDRSFIEKFEVILYDGANVFTSDTSRGRMAIQLLKNRSDVAVDRGYNPNYHRWYIAEENEEELDRIKVDDLENEALFYLTEVQKKYPEFKMYQIAVQLKNHQNISLVKGDVAPSIVKDQLNRFIKNKDKYKTENIEKFMKVVTNFKENPKRFEVDYVLAQGFNTNILYTDAGSVFWKTKMAEANVYKWKNEDALRSFMLEEADKYNPKDKTQTNYYKDIVDELTAKGVRFK